MATPMNEDPKAKSKKPSNSAFKQQRLPAWQPILTAGTVLPTFFVIGLAFIPIGIGLLVSSNDVREFPLDYTRCHDEKQKDETCESILAKNITTECTCVLFFNLTEAYKANVYMYYGLTNYYQNHRRYVKSRDDQQLLGKDLELLSKDCEPFKFSTVGSNVTQIAPCGAIANSLFNDSFRLHHFDSSKGNEKENWVEVSLNKTGIIWPTDHKKFQNPKGGTDKLKDKAKPPNWSKAVYELDPTNENNNGFQNEELIVWMRTAALPTFRKLYGRVNHNDFRRSLPAGLYRLTVNYRYRVAPFKGTKRMILSNTSWLGGKNPFLGVAYIVVGTICLMLAFVFLVIHNKFGRSTHEIVNINQRTSY